MKLPQLLSQFLYQTRKLDLPGIGSFTLDQGVVLPGDPDRADTHPQQAPASGISFRNTPIHTPDDELIRFIQTHTGKMKPLAAADLDFFLTSGKQMLNIGKPFFLEGIGTLLATKDGLLSFTPGEYSTARLEEPGPTKRQRPDKRDTGTDDSSTRYTGRSIPASSGSNASRQVLLLLGIIGGLVIIGWGGYSLYKKNTVPAEPSVAEHPQTVTHDTAATVRTDSNLNVPHPATLPPPAASGSQATVSVSPPGPGMNLYKFIILETTHKGHALRRYNQLLGFQLNIKMEQKDSAFFKLYFPISATLRDTTHIKDSLEDVYAAHVSIER